MLNLFQMRFYATREAARRSAHRWASAGPRMKYPHQVDLWQGEGTLVHPTSGMQLRFDAVDPDGTTYLRVCDPAGDEIMHWSSDEWAEDPVLVMGAIMGSMCRTQYATEDRYAAEAPGSETENE